jgi:hypothetical protein
LDGLAAILFIGEAEYRSRTFEIATAVFGEFA